LLPLFERGFSPSPKCGTRGASLPVEKRFSEESSFLVLLIDNIVPLVEATSNLFRIHSDNEVTHNSVSLLLHLGSKMLLFAFVLFNSHLELRDLLFMLFLSSIELPELWVTSLSE
jgi:hypothetical protein